MPPGRCSRPLGWAGDCRGTFEPSKSHCLGHEGVVFVSDLCELLRKVWVPSRLDLAESVFEPPSQAREGVKQPVGISVMAGLPHGAERGLPNETRRVQATGLGARCDAGELVGVETLRYGGAMQAWMLHGCSKEA